jgi:hypothetical protein
MDANATNWWFRLKGRSKRATWRSFMARKGEIEARKSRKGPPMKWTTEMGRSRMRKDAAKLYGRGFKKSQIARVMSNRFFGPTEEVRYRKARATLSRWESQESFRDMIYQHAVVKLDLETPGILNGVAKKAKMGRVDAARFSLEVTGRHVPRGDVHPTQIVLQMGNIPRPADIEVEAAELEGPQETELEGQ